MTRIALVTGVTGFLGSRTAKRLQAEGYTVRGLVRNPEKATGMGIEVFEGEVTDREAVRQAVQGAYLVVHTVAATGPDLATSLLVNGEGTRIIAEEALAAGVERLVHISSDAVYDFTGDPAITEETPFNPGGNFYDQGKIAAEQAVRAAAALPSVILRPTCILGAGATSTWGTKVPLALKNQRFRLFGQGEGTFPYIHVENLVDCILLAATKPEAVGQAYDTNDGHTTWRDYAAYFERELGFPAPATIPLESAPAFFRWQGTISAEKIRRELGYIPSLTYEEGMAEAVAYLRGMER